MGGTLSDVGRVLTQLLKPMRLGLTAGALQWGQELEARLLETELHPHLPPSTHCSGHI